MFPKLLMALVLAIMIGSAIFSLRQQQLQLMHEITAYQRQMNNDRQATWDAQVRIANQTTPSALHDAIVRAGIQMEPNAANNVNRELAPQDIYATTTANHETR